MTNLPAYYVLPSRVREIMERHFTGWGYEMSDSGQNFYVKAGNVGFTKQLIKEAGLSDMVEVRLMTW